MVEVERVRGGVEELELVYLHGGVRLLRVEIEGAARSDGDHGRMGVGVDGARLGHAVDEAGSCAVERGIGHKVLAGVELQVRARKGLKLRIDHKGDAAGARLHRHQLVGLAPAEAGDEGFGGGGDGGRGGAIDDGGVGSDVGEGVDHDIDVEDGIVVDPDAHGDGDQRARGDGGEARDLHSCGIFQLVLEGVGVDSGGPRENRALLDVDGVASDLQDEGGVEVAREEDGDRDVLHGGEVVFDGGGGRHALGSEDSHRGRVAHRLVGDAQLADLQRSDRVVRQTVDRNRPRGDLQRVVYVRDLQAELPPHHELLVEDHLDDVRAHHLHREDLRRRAGDRDGGDEGGDGELEVARDGEEEGGEGRGDGDADVEGDEEGGEGGSGGVGILGVDGDDAHEVVVAQLEEELPHVPVLLLHDARPAHHVHLEALRQRPDRGQIVAQDHLQLVARPRQQRAAETDHHRQRALDVGVDGAEGGGIDGERIGRGGGGGLEVDAGGGEDRAAEERAGEGRDGRREDGEDDHQVGTGRHLIAQLEAEDEVRRRGLRIRRGDYRPRGQQAGAH